MCILGFSKTFMETLNSASLIFSKPISRTDFMLENTQGIFLLTFFYCFCTCFLFSILFLLKSGVIPYQFVLAILLLPIAIIALYSLVTFLALSFESYPLTVFISFIYVGFQPMLSNSEMAQLNFGIENANILKLIEGLFFVFPNIYGGIQLMSEYIRGDFEIMSVFQILLSCVPIFIFSLFLIKRKDF